MPEQKFTVKTKDKLTDLPHDIVVGGPQILTQEDAEAYVAGMARASGGTHPGFEIVPADPDKFAKRLAETAAKAKE